MARPIRFQYPGACYHVMARGDGGKVIFEDEDDREVFISRLGEVCGRCGWKVHAWVLGIYAKGRKPDWLVTERVLRAFELAEDGRGRRAYVGWLEARAADGGKINPVAEKALRRGWYLGEETFKDKLLAIIDGANGEGKNRRKAKEGVARDHGEGEALRLIREAGKRLELDTRKPVLAKMRKGDSRKVLIAALLRKRTAVGVNWIAERLEMGHPGSLSRLLGKARRDPGFKKKIAELEKMLFSED